MQHGGIFFHVKFFFGNIPIQGEDHVGIGFDRSAWFFNAVSQGSGFNQNQGLVDIGDNDVGFFVERNKGVFTFNAGAVDHKFVDGSGDVVESNSAGFQEFLIFVVFGFASWARVGESEVVFDLGSFQAFFEVDRFDNFHLIMAAVRRFHGLRWFGDGVQSFAFTFQGFFHDAEEFGLFAFRSVDVGQSIIFQSFQGIHLVFFLKVDLQQVQNTTFDVGGPWLIFTIEHDVTDQATVVGEFDGQQQLFFVFVFHVHFFEHFEWYDFARVGQVVVHFANSNVVDFHQASVRGFENERNHGLDSGARVLFAGAGDTSGHLTVVQVVKFATGLKLIVVNVADVVDIVAFHPTPFLNSCKGKTQAEYETQRELHCSLVS
jgi:hypothetical protein